MDRVSQLRARALDGHAREHRVIVERAAADGVPLRRADHLRRRRHVIPAAALLREEELEPSLRAVRDERLDRLRGDALEPREREHAIERDAARGREDVAEAGVERAVTQQLREIYGERDVGISRPVREEAAARAATAATAARAATAATAAAPASAALARRRAHRTRAGDGRAGHVCVGYRHAANAP